MNRARALLLPLAFAASCAAADSIVLNGKRLGGVYIVESSRAVYVSNPADGSTQSFAKTDPALGEINIMSDEAAREALRAEYEARRLEREQKQPGVSDLPANFDVQIHSASDDTPITPLPKSASTTPVLRLKGEPGSASRIGMPDFVSTNNSQNAPGSSQGLGAGGGFSGAGIPGNTAMGGSMGGGGASAGGGGGRGGGGNGQGNAFGFRNISDLFDSTNDAAVGETPNPITGR